MKIAVLGSAGTPLCQINDVAKGIESFGHKTSIFWTDPDITDVFVGNPPFEPYLGACEYKRFVFNVLDVCPHCSDHADIVKRLSEQLPLAAKVTTISKTVQSQLLDLCGVKSEVIYYPMKPITFTRDKKYPKLKVLMAGRTSDPNKRCHSSILALVKAGYREEEVAIVGPEYPGWGTKIGTVSNWVLNDIFNSVDYVMMLSKEEGIGLPAIEAACAGAIPIVMPDLSTYEEFWASSPMGPFYQTFTSIDKISQFIVYMDNRPEEKEIMKLAMLQYANTHFRPKFDNVEVAKKIINVFHSI